MNQSVDTPSQPTLRYHRNQQSKEPAAFQRKEESLDSSTFKQQTTVLQRLATFPSLALTLALTLAILLHFQTHDIIEKEGSKALFIILVLCLLKHLSQPTKQV